MRRLLRYLQIAFSGTCAIACVLLVALCVRSYWRLDVFIRNSNSQSTIVRTDTGLITISVSKSYVRSAAFGGDGWTHIVDNASWGMNYWQFDWIWNAEIRLIRIPIWVLSTAFAALGFVPSIRWSNRFSIRALLIGTALIAAVLAMVVSFNR